LHYILAPSNPDPPSKSAASGSNVDVEEEGEAMDALDEDDADMMAMMGIGGFGSTKVQVYGSDGRTRLISVYMQGKQVEGNQEGSVKVKKIRTWRQYMNRYAWPCNHLNLFSCSVLRRGGFNRCSVI
jgi:U4/U6.U5 tri-snRNP-associated protein 3